MFYFDQEILSDLVVQVLYRTMVVSDVTGAAS